MFSITLFTELCKIFTLGLPRCLAKDDVIGGYFIPAGSLMIFNTWYVWFSSLFKVFNTRGLKKKKKGRFCMTKLNTRNHMNSFPNAILMPTDFAQILR